MNEWACSVDWPKAIGVIKDVIVASAAIATSFVAWRGVEKWRSEESGKADFDLARRLGKAVYKYRDALRAARTPLVSRSEYPADFNHGGASTAELEAAWSYIFRARWKPLQEAAAEVRLLSHEVAALWGEQAHQAVDELLRSANVVYFSMVSYVANEKSGGKNFANMPEVASRIADQLFDSGWRQDEEGNYVEGNKLTAHVDQAIKDLMDILRTKLPTHSKSPSAARQHATP